MKQTKSKQQYQESSPLEPVNFKSIGSNNDPCFGKLYDLTTQECKICGDSELCCSVFAKNQGKTRRDIEKESEFKDMEILVDKTAAKKTIRLEIRKDSSKKEILDRLQGKYEISRDQARKIYREYLESKAQ